MRLLETIGKKIESEPYKIEAYDDYFSICRSVEEKDFEAAHKGNAWLRSMLAKNMKDSGKIQLFFELYKKTLLFDAKYDFDCYLLYLEIDREPKERFYQPRRKILLPLVQAMQDLADDKLDELFLSMPPRVGKLLADDTPVLTTNGWKPHGELKVGDKVFNHKGEAVSVLAVHPKYQTEYTVTLSDGSTFECHGNHEWYVYDRRFQRYRTMETKEMIGKLDNSKTQGTNRRGHRYMFQIPIKEPIEGRRKQLPVPPYTFGAWLGDGSNQRPRITGDKLDTPIIDKIVSEGYTVAHVYVHKTTGVLSHEFCTELRKDLQKIGMCHSRRRVEKHIPSQYLTSSKEQRLELLAGLLDTDGTLVRKEHRYQYTTCEKKLKDDFVALVSTFGWRCCIREVEPYKSSSGIEGKQKYWCIAFNPTEYIPCQLERKKLTEYSKQRKIAITNIKQSDPKQGNCITVEGGIYLVGKTMQPTHNSSIVMFFITWILGRYPEKSNLYSAYSDTITSAFYNGVLEVINDPNTYLWHDVFPSCSIVSTNSKDETLNIDRRKRYPSLTCRSLYGTLNGACDCNGFLISDDLIGGIEEALNKDRLVAAWSKVDNNFLPRAKEFAKRLWVGTRWSIIDPAGIRMELLKNDKRFANVRYKIINVPALDEKDESNFDYDYGVGFSTEYYRQRRASFERNNDSASWFAQYMGRPIEREGVLFSPTDFRYYNGTLPDEEPDRIFMAVDPAFGGGDFVAAPICFQYGDDVYVHDVVFDDGDKRITLPLLVDAIGKYDVAACQIEVSKATSGYKDELAARLKEKNLRINLVSKAASPLKAKEQRIFDKAPNIRENMIFRESGKRSKAYELFMQNVFSFKMFGKNKHDDAPDSLAMAIDMAFGRQREAKVFTRMF